MTTRRDFLAAAALFSAGLLVSPALLARDNKYNKKYIGLQLYTGRHFSNDYAFVRELQYSPLRYISDILFLLRGPTT